MWFLIILIVIAIITVCTVVSADRESFLVEKKGKIRDLSDMLVEGLSIEEVKGIVSKFKGVSEPSFVIIDDNKDIYVSTFDWKEGSCQYKGEIKMYFENDCLINREVSLL